ncbi:RluA family pseudouridine synthase [Comamonas sp. NLF-1-9]|uniref:RluA family pseudouridine synthase n=1 Tax=Comamonas sp. NLF-1-9 TaxID=2853163 RepID=UPI001C484045|nr:RluA family pseudouridine synthase [Comamonas sp. NLF-1-9]QXL84981.1 RluA family pseudouridine synthase [Comamonas sp. NLF-1-9]
MNAAPAADIDPAAAPACASGANAPPLPAPAPLCLYADEDLLALAKPAGLLCVPGRGPHKQDALSTRAQRHWPGALVVHRLDQATSGLVLMARHPEAQRRLGAAFAAQAVHKYYQALVHGCPRAAPLAHPRAQEPGWSVIDLPLAPDWPRRPLQKVDHAGGKPSQTLWRMLACEAGGARSRLLLQPLSGRTHQLRLHLAHIGHPIVGDRLYGQPGQDADAPRLLLHAWRLALAHPRTGQWLELACPLPF